MSFETTALRAIVAAAVISRSQPVGADVPLNEYFPANGNSWTHFAAPAASQPLYLPWVADRLAGKPAPDGCAAQQVQQ